VAYGLGNRRSILLSYGGVFGLNASSVDSTVGCTVCELVRANDASHVSFDVLVTHQNRIDLLKNFSPSIAALVIELVVHVPFASFVDRAGLNVGKLVAGNYSLVRE
jgi:hypothetical protein